MSNKIITTEIDGKLFRVMGEYKFPMNSIEEEEENDRKRLARIKKFGPAHFPMKRDYVNDENWEEDAQLPSGVYPVITERINEIE